MTSHPIVGFEKLQKQIHAVTTSAWLERSSRFLRWFHRFFVCGTRESFFETGEKHVVFLPSRSSGMWTHLPRLKSRVKFEVDSPNWWNFFRYMFWPKKYGVFMCFLGRTGPDMRFSCWIWIINFNLWSKMGFVHHVWKMRIKCCLSVASTSSDQLVN